jgi:Protein of unknown function (DUF1631)
MNRNDLLAATRDQFLRDFSQCVPKIITSCVDSLYAKAEKAQSSAAERRYFDVRTALTRDKGALQPAITKSLEKLLHRSFQTAYNNLQTSSLKGGKASSLSLVDTSAVDFDMRLDGITKTYRDVAGNELRDLNIRVALLFLQENIKERENPFRPYLLARSLRNAVEILGLSNEESDLLADEMSEALRPHVLAIYTALNQLLSKNGVGAELKLTVRKTLDNPNTTSPPTTTGPTAAEIAAEAEAHNKAKASGQNPTNSAARPTQSGGPNTSGGVRAPMVGGWQAPPVAPTAAEIQQQMQQQMQQAQFAASRQRIESFINWVQHPEQPIPTGPAATTPSMVNANIGSGGRGGNGSGSGSPNSGAMASNAMGHGGTAGVAVDSSVDNNVGMQQSEHVGDGNSSNGNHGIAGADRINAPQRGVGNNAPSSSSHATGFGAAPSGSASYDGSGQMDMSTLPLEEPGPFTIPSEQRASEPNFGAGYGASTQQPGGAVQSSSPSPSYGPARSWMHGVQAIGTTFRRLFSFGSATALGVEDAALSLDGDSSEDIAKPVDRYGMTGSQRAISPKLMQSVRELLDTPLSAEAMRNGDDGIRNLIMERREALAAVTEDISEQMTIDVVAMLFEFILRDPDVPSETRAQLGRLQFLVLKVALRDIEFFTHQSHPARMLVNRVGSLAHALKQVDPNGQNLNEEVCRIVEVLLADDDGDVKLFGDMVDELDRFVASQLRSAREEIELAAQAMDSIESRTLKFARITSAIADSLSFLKVDANLQRLLVDTWANVVEIVQRHQPENARRFRQLVPELVWSVAPKVDKADRSLLISMLPPMLRTLREGMNLLNWDQPRQDQELAWLVENHTYALRSAPVASTVPPLSMIRERFKAFVEQGEDAPLEGGDIVADTRRVNSLLLLDAGREFGAELNVIDDILAADPDVAEPIVERAQTTEQGDVEDEIIKRLRAGVRIMLQLVGEPRPAHLTWVSPTATTLMLNFDNTDKSFVVSLRMFLRLLASDRASFAEGEPLFERAVRKLLESADDMDRAGQEPSTQF